MPADPIRRDLVRAYRATLYELRSQGAHAESCDHPDCYPQDRRERLALGALADALRIAYRTLNVR